MTWRSQLVDASFRGVPFFVDKATLSVGRRTVVHEFPGRATPLVEDLGRAPRRWQLEMVVIGDQYLARRDALRLALERPGPGDLVLPTMGTVRAVVEGVSSISESVSEGGVCRVSATFVEATSKLRVASLEMPALDVSDSYAALSVQASLAVTADFEAAQGEAARMSVAVDGAGTQAAIAELVESARAQATIAQEIQACAELLRTAQRQVGLAGDRAREMAERAVALAAAPGDLVEEVFATAGDMVDALLAAGDAAGALWRDLDPGWRLRDLLRAASASLAQARTSVVPESLTPAQLHEARVAASLTRATGAALAAAAARASTTIDFRSARSASRVSEALCELIDIALADPPATPAAEALRVSLGAMRSAVARHLQSVVDELPRVGTHTPLTTLPDIAIAQQLYGDATRHEEIRRLNDLSNPLFCPGGMPLEVLSGD